MTYRNGNYESSGLDNWMTPRHIIEELENEFGELFDPCPAYHDGSFDGLQISWPRDKVCFVNPPSLDDVFNIAGKGEVMPQKSTFFFPKVFSGLVTRCF